MGILHHPDTATLMAYGAGTLEEAFSVLVASHVSECEACRAVAREAEELGAALAEPLDAGQSDFDALMARIDAADPEPEVKPQVGGDVPVPLARLIGNSLDEIRWRLIAPGVRKADFSGEVSGNASLFMLQIAPGKAMPEHGHVGSEMTLILRGAYADEFGRFGAGDIADHDADVEHTPVVEPGNPCICIVAADSKARFTSPIARLLQPLAGI